eukprot:TRINITY_DN1728_c0_g4_i1.p1 TRINITY_DN1728_c0_g4~~TRINITY_DN1728_c0_g4_i1.p1  ORF type:complete len:257 (-),score=48.18 TRINITY_DN1728_c0_g4_i1:58-828(-)
MASRRDSGIVYAMIVCKLVPVADYATTGGTFKQYCVALLPLLKQRYKQSSYHFQEHAIHVLGSDNRSCLFICVSSQSCKKEHAFSYLNELFIQFENDFSENLAAYHNGYDSPLPYEMNKSFHNFLHSVTQRYNRSIRAGLDPYTHLIQADSEDPSLGTIHTFELEPGTVRRRIKIPFLVQEEDIIDAAGKDRVISYEDDNFFSRWLARHPYFMIGFCIFLGLLLLLYFVVIVPLCGYNFMKVDPADGKFVCWFDSE